MEAFGHIKRCSNHIFTFNNFNQMQKKQSKRKPNREAFDICSRSSALENQYNALLDPHANYYFVSKAAKQRLKDLKHGIKMEKGKKSSQQKIMLKLIKDKIKFEFPKIKLPFLDPYSGNDGRKSSEQQLKYSTEQLRNANLKQVNSSRNARQGLKKQQVRGEEIAFKKADSKRQKVSHENFIKFLANKKQQLRSFTAQNQDFREETE